MKSNSKWFLVFSLMAIFAMVAVTSSTATLLVGPTIVVTPTNTQGWSTADTRPGGAVNFVLDGSAPAGLGALQLTTDATNAAKAQYMHAANVPLADVTELSYYTKQISASFAEGEASYQLPVCLGGFVGTTCVGFTTLVFEPYWNPGLGNPGGNVIPNVWQEWNVDAGQFWSSSNANGGGACTTVSGAGGPPFYTLAGLKSVCPNAVVVGFGVNIGTYNPSYNVYTDLFNFNGTVYDFEPYEVATNADQCKKGGYLTVNRADGSGFKNQGDCIQYVNTGK